MIILLALALPIHAEPPLVPAATIVEALVPKSAKIRPRIDISAIEFQVDSTELANDRSQEQVHLLAKALADPRLANAMVSLVGHASADGDEAHNLDLSQRRADAIRTILIRDYHIPETRLAAWGKGEAALLPNLPPESPQNRRVEVIREE